MYQRAILTSASVIVLCTSAFAGDLGRAAPAGYKDGPYWPVQNWSGFYIGAGGGGGSADHNLRAFYGNETSGNLNGGGTGDFGTLQIGYDRHIGRHLVIGAFFDYDFANIDSRANATYKGNTYELKATLEDSWTLGGRAGYLVNPSTLVYGLAGYTEAHFDQPLNLNGDFSGWTGGAGIETSLGGPLFLKGEYRFTQLDEKTLYSKGTFKVTDQPDIQTGRLVLGYRLNNAGYYPVK